MTTVRFQADADLRQAIVTGVTRRHPSLDFQSANQAGLEGIKESLRQLRLISGVKDREILELFRSVE